MKPIVLIASFFSPYHLARLRGLNKYLSNVIAIELSSKETMHRWNTEHRGDLNIISLSNDSSNRISEKSLSKRMIRKLNVIRPSCIIIPGYYNLIYRDAARWAHERNIITIMLTESNYEDKKRSSFKELIKSIWINKFFNAIFAGGASSSYYLKRLRYPMNKIWRGCDIVDNDYFSRNTLEIRKNAKHYKDKFDLPDKYFLYVGRFSEEKNLIRLIKAYKIYKSYSKVKTWNLVLLGGGPQENRLKNLARKLNLNDIIWPGFKQIDKLIPYYALASCFILPSTREPWGLVINEAMASGLPILASERCGCVLNLVFPGINGYILDPLDINDIAQKMFLISSLKNQSIEYMSMYSKKIISTYDLNLWGRALADCVRYNLKMNKK